MHFLSDFWKLSVLRPAKDHKSGNGTTEEVSDIVSEAVDAVINEKKKVKEWKFKFSETESFSAPVILDSYSEP